MHVMNIVKMLSDYSKTDEQKDMVAYLKEVLPSVVCYEPIKNKDFIMRYMTPLNDFCIYTTAVPCADASRVLR